MKAEDDNTSKEEIEKLMAIVEPIEQEKSYKVANADAAREVLGRSGKAAAWPDDYSRGVLAR